MTTRETALRGLELLPGFYHLGRAHTDTHRDTPCHVWPTQPTKTPHIHTHGAAPSVFVTVAEKERKEKRERERKGRLSETVKC